jgi:hypothetical protein
MNKVNFTKEIHSNFPNDEKTQGHKIESRLSRFIKDEIISALGWKADTEFHGKNDDLLKKDDIGRTIFHRAALE